MAFHRRSQTKCLFAMLSFLQLGHTFAIPNLLDVTREGALSEENISTPRFRRKSDRRRFLNGESESNEKHLQELIDSFAEDTQIFRNMELSMSSPTTAPSLTTVPSSFPIDAKSEAPTEQPTGTPSASPSASPTTLPTSTVAPSSSPTATPSTAMPSTTPTASPTFVPSFSPSLTPTTLPTSTVAPSSSPTATPTTAMPSFSPSSTPTSSPSASPTVSASSSPTSSPSSSPSFFPTVQPTVTCNLTPTLRREEIDTNLALISDSLLLFTEGTPQYKAKKWITEEDSYFICPDDPNLAQRYILAVLYFSTSGDDWFKCGAPESFNDTASIVQANTDCELNGKDADAWLTPSLECEWAGITCNRTNSKHIVNVISIERNGLNGTLPDELRGLSEIRELALEQGNIGGRIPTFYGEMSKLEVLDLNFNKLEGSIPDDIYSITTLQQLDLNDNELVGSISTLIGKLTDLTFLQMEYNDMTGVIPTELGSLKNLEVATLNNNQFQGTMPQQVCDNRNTEGGELVALVVDCLGGSSRPSPPYVECSRGFSTEPACCTLCT